MTCRSIGVGRLAMQRFWLVCALLMISSRAHADAARERAWAAIKEWRGTITFTANDTSSGSLAGTDVTITTNSSMNASFTLRVDQDRTSSSPVWIGKPAGKIG